MIAFAGFFAAAAACAFVLGGYLLGAKRGVEARRALLSTREAKDEQLRVAEIEMVHLKEIARRPAPVVAPPAPPPPPDENVKQMREELRSLASAVMDRERSQEALKAQIQGYLQDISKTAPDAETLRKDLQRMMSPLLARENETKGLREMMRELVGPMLEKQRFGIELSQVDARAGHLGELPRLLDSIAEKGSFATVVLSDEVGLPLAASSNARDVELLAGVSSILMSITDRVVGAGAAAPTSIVVRDDANQNTVHRIFRASGIRYMLTAVTRGSYLTPESLDPVLAKLERVLTKQEVLS